MFSYSLGLYSLPKLIKVCIFYDLFYYMTFSSELFLEPYITIDFDCFVKTTIATLK